MLLVLIKGRFRYLRFGVFILAFAPPMDAIGSTDPHNDPDSEAIRNLDCLAASTVVTWTRLSWSAPCADITELATSIPYYRRFSPRRQDLSRLVSPPENAFVSLFNGDLPRLNS